MISPPATTVSISDSEFDEMVDSFYSPEVVVLSESPRHPPSSSSVLFIEERLHKTNPPKRSIATQTDF